MELTSLSQQAIANFSKDSLSQDCYDESSEVIVTVRSLYLPDNSQNRKYNNNLLFMSWHEWFMAWQFYADMVLMLYPHRAIELQGYIRILTEISIFMLLCHLIDIEDSGWWNKEIQHYCIESLLLKANILQQLQLDFNMFISKFLIITTNILILPHLTLDQYFMKELPFAKSLTDIMDANATPATSNTSALFVNSNHTENLLVSEINQIGTTPLTQNLLIHEPSNRERTNFRSFNNNQIWINNKLLSTNSPFTKSTTTFQSVSYQWKASRELTTLGPPSNHSMVLSLTAHPPPDHPFTSQEQDLL